MFGWVIVEDNNIALCWRGGVMLGFVLGRLSVGTLMSNTERRGASAGMTRRTSHTSARSAAIPAFL